MKSSSFQPVPKPIADSDPFLRDCQADDPCARSGRTSFVCPSMRCGSSSGVSLLFNSEVSGGRVEGQQVHFPVQQFRSRAIDLLLEFTLEGQQFAFPPHGEVDPSLRAPGLQVPFVESQRKSICLGAVLFAWVIFCKTILTVNDYTNERKRLSLDGACLWHCDFYTCAEGRKTLK